MCRGGRNVEVFQFLLQSFRFCLPLLEALHPVPADQPETVPFPGQSVSGIVMTEKQTVFRPACQKSVRFLRAFGDQVIDLTFSTALIPAMSP